MAIKKGDLVKVIELIGFDSSDGVELNKTYKVITVSDYYIEIHIGKYSRLMYYNQIEKVKKKSGKDLRIEELENQVKQIQNILNNK